MSAAAAAGDRGELYQLALRYARAADRRDYAAFAAITTEDAVIAVHHGDPADTEPTYSMQGHAQIQRAMQGLEQYAKTLHVVSNQLVEIEGDAASGETYCVAHHIHERDGVPHDYSMYIRYQDRFLRKNGRWLFSERRLWVEFTSDRPLEMG